MTKWTEKHSSLSPLHRPYAHILLNEEIEQLKRRILGNLEHRFCENDSKVEQSPSLTSSELKAFSPLEKDVCLG